MKIARVFDDGRSAIAAIEDDRAHVLGSWHVGEDALLVPAQGLDHASLARLRNQSTENLPLSQIRLLAPVGPAAKIICLGINYPLHADEILADHPATPALFGKMADVLVGPDEALERPVASQAFDYEGEIAVVIGKEGRHIAAADALDHVFGYTIMMDGSIRDFQQQSLTAGKCFWHSGALGPWVLTADEVPDPKTLALETRLNGKTVQSTTADLMLYDIPAAISYISQWTKLRPGDVIATGTPGGVGAMRQPPLWMKAGDIVEVEVSQIGILRNPVIDETAN